MTRGDVKLFSDWPEDIQLKAIKRGLYADTSLNMFAIEKLESPRIHQAIKDFREKVKSLNNDDVRVYVDDGSFDLVKSGDILVFLDNNKLFEAWLKVPCKFPERTVEGTIEIKIGKELENIKYNISRDDLISWLVDKYDTCKLECTRGKMEYSGVQDYDSFFTKEGSTLIKGIVKKFILNLKEIFEEFLKKINEATEFAFTPNNVLEELKNKDYKINGEEAKLMQFDGSGERYDFVF